MLGFQKVALLKAAAQLHWLLRGLLITLNYIGQPLPPGGRASLRAELKCSNLTGSESLCRASWPGLLAAVGMVPSCLHRDGSG